MTADQSTGIRAEQPVEVRAAIIAADGFEEVEGLTVVDLLRRAKITCDIVSLSDADIVTGSHGIRICIDRRFSETDFDSYDAVILPGGLRGTDALKADERVLALLQHMYATGKLTAAICAAPTVLAKAGLLNGRKATCYPSAESMLTDADFSTETVVCDGTIITSRGAGTTIPFALSIIAYLDSQAHADEIARKIVYLT
jgi:4-methyl-5(b-hydroxyethyl)-thiazole monophosphate biosynthesis